MLTVLIFACWVVAFWSGGGTVYLLLAYRSAFYRRQALMWRRRAQRAERQHDIVLLPEWPMEV